ncbi:DegT/DnrJ/EryC1/StrS aminotransferase family protein [Jiella sp. MQZ9-1]|uniref:DegT/DnrJ/EryC1/StrS aminotransferase family protein n=1 Tax=Jiella flava TaxID=2816857 RepID=A0A939FZU7_9HYPH|nr:DegT/DnrJ/EryC1/StrS aminotransferase family protein [Jiella flava]MBO0663766.1 DegT/DnrJ/EryC1/StrS aminotransferase family protein [Jiella flava]MCD2472339.1 DegT/DnrJ/EryC1/StrS aminotransferase family protein [Jiella flava]
MQTIPFIDLQTQRDRIRDKVDRRIAAVLDHGAFIMGPEMRELEAALSRFGGMEHTLSCASGTDALALPLMAWDIKPGDAVFCPSFTFAATAEVIAWLHAVPYFVDVDPGTFNMDVASLEAAIAEVKAAGKLTPRAIIAVDLFGQPADYPAIREIAAAHGLKLISDAAQGYGGTIGGQLSSAFADVVSTSFFPAKPLGCYGDGGAVQTNDAELAAVMTSLRVHGQNLDDKYDNIRIGMNGRMDTIQAAILLEKLAIFPDEIKARSRIAARYSDQLNGIVTPQALLRDAVSTWAQYTVRLPAGTDRESVQGKLRESGVPTAIYYPKPLHRQTAYQHFPVARGELAVSDALSRDVISLPMHAYLDEATQDRIVAALTTAVKG